MAIKAMRLLCVALVIATVGACSKDGELLGEPGKEADVDRVVAITASDELRFDPSKIAVQQGETIEFQITNTGKSEHEFVLGPGGHQHDTSMSMAESNSTGAIPSGETATLYWNFTTAGEVPFACHIAGHDKQGMTGLISISD
jgi:uncharacterized cupredoxin-like copper-binding protein